ncbi:MAG: ChbG/HpnK family deacetylase [candidate division Zixibacteria bacterium]|nr:ChbG/HpnK family deacetylase [candidate division Zixibacteria bacterium]
MLFESIKDIVKIFSAPENYPLEEDNRTLAKICGFSENDRLLIVNADDFGLCSSTNRAVAELIDKEVVNSVSMFASAENTDEGLELLGERRQSTGIHLTLTSEWENHVLSPVLPGEMVHSLLNGSGQFYSEIKHLYLTADNDEVEAECRAQIEHMLDCGIIIDHLDTHMGAMQLRPDFVEIYLKLASEYNLPMRMGSKSLAQLMGLPAEQLDDARKMGLAFPDNLIYIPMSFTPDKKIRFQAYECAVRNIPPGITEIYFHPSYNGDDFKALQHEYSKRKDISYESIRLWDYEFLADGLLSRILEEEEIKLISYADLMQVQRKTLKVID